MENIRNTFDEDMYDFDDPNTILVNSKHEPIISKELWDLAQTEMAKNKKWCKPRQRLENNINFWIKGLIRCKECGISNLF